MKNKNKNENKTKLTCNDNKVTIRPDFTGRVQNFDGLSRENYEVSRDVELSRFANSVRFCPGRFDCNVAKFIYLIGLISVPNSLLSDAFFRAPNAPNPFSAGAPPGPR